MPVISTSPTVVTAAVVRSDNNSTVPVPLPDICNGEFDCVFNEVVKEFLH